MSLVQVKPLLHNSSLMENKNDKIKDNISEISQIMQMNAKMCDSHVAVFG